MSTLDPRDQQSRDQPSRQPGESREQQQRPSDAQRPSNTDAASPTSSATNRTAASTPTPTSPSASTPTSTSTSASASPSAAAPRTRGSSGGGVALAIAALVLGLVLGAFGMKIVDNSGDDDGNVLAGTIDENGYQAVILTNDKVYFGRLREVNDTFFRLDDAFFLRETRESPDAEPVRALLPINRELHVPENRMLIRQDEVVLVENLDKESPLLDEIERQTGGSGS